jgi:lysophospholipase L1-like esterase
MSLNKRSMHYRKKNLVFWLLMIIGTLTIAEFTLGISSLMSPRVAALLSPDQVPAIDRNGFRNKFVPDTVSIVALGDSQTYGVGVSRDQAWPQRLDTLSNVPTYNMGVPGWGPTQSLVILGQAMALRPKLIIEAFYAGNDLFDSYQHVYKAKQLSDLKTSDERVAKALTDAENIEPLDKKISKVSDTPAGRTFLRDFLSEHSKLYGLLRVVKIVVNEHMKHEPDWASIKQGATGKAYYQIFDNGNLRTILTPDYRLTALELNDPRMREGQRIFLEAIQLMQKQAQAANVEFIVLLIPTKELVFKEAVYENMADPPKTYQTLITNEELMWQKTKDFFTDQGILFIDALPALRQCLRSATQPYPMSSDGHPNAIGHQAIAEHLRSEIKEHGLLR